MKSRGKTFTLFLVGVLLLAVVESGCIGGETTTTTITAPSPGPTETASSPTTTTAAPKYPITVTDFAGRTVTIEKPPERVIVLSGYWAEILCVLGVQDRIVGIGKYVPYDPYLPDDVKNKTVVGSNFKGLNWETVVGLNPDLIIIDWYGGKYADAETIQKAEELGIPVIALTARTIEDNVEVVKLLGKVFGEEKKAGELARWMEEKLSAVKETAAQIPESERKNALLISAPKDIAGPVTVYATGSAWASMVELIGAHNLAFDMTFDTQWPKLDLEKIIAYWGNDTDVLILTSFSQDRLEDAMNGIKNDSRWQEIKAVREGHVYGILAGSKGYLDWGPRIIVGLYQMANIIYPDRYQSWESVRDELIEKFYSPFYQGG
ncbi:ABC transporter substrate-binding protein [Thermococcus sp. GR7]|uniref:ABC transporter substrate-binding protein n=1 Tax=unclassified Thermococcus TaxID=2627626 RepID=UPI00143071EE|nr:MULTISPECIES: ABC transporter substrate-binding protein [unclassified Thermococcus]NJE45896.1 ABC transporter substrate-binding protein [Thermococcus sp. GR7]NJE78787.1 ABC transporter substrate-binding protein [Thermococcus sp. GR4]NJF22091.1 ABC transporter substrate-binding protein [Thermococcus sp. GR5]